jgi:integrase
MEQIRQAEVYGVRPSRTFRQAATKYLNEAEKASLDKDAWNLERIDTFIGHLPLENVHMGTLRPYVDYGRRKGWKNRTINYPMEVVRHILNLAAGEWLDENGLTWLRSAPKIRLLPRSDAREPYPLSWDEQTKLFAVLPEHLRMMSLFAVNTGLRKSEVCGLRWDDEVEIEALETSVFIIPRERIKNREDRLVVLNRVAKAVIDRVRGDHPACVFIYKGAPVKSIYNTAWKEARKAVDLSLVRVHDLKHTFGRRLRAAGVSFEDRQDLLGHKSGRITTHYSAPELINLIEASERVCPKNWRNTGSILFSRAACGNESRKSPALTILKKKNPLRVVNN